LKQTGEENKIVTDNLGEEFYSINNQKKKAQTFQRTVFDGYCRHYNSESHQTTGKYLSRNNKDLPISVS